MHLSLSLSLFSRGASRDDSDLAGRSDFSPGGSHSRGPRSFFAPALCSVVLVAAVLPGFAAAEETCPNAQFRVGPSANLPDCRAYEQVTPVEKDGGIFEFQGSGPGPGGAPGLVLNSFAAIDGVQDNSGVPGDFYSTVRTDSGWATSPLPLPASEYQTSTISGGLTTYLAGSLDGRSALWQARQKSQSESSVDFYVTRPGGNIEDVGPLAPPGTPPGEVKAITQGLQIVATGVSDDLSHIAYGMAPESSSYHLWPFDTTNRGEKSLYEFVGTNNLAPLLVGVDNNGGLVSNCGTVLGGTTSKGGPDLQAHNAMSGNGDVVFFTALACGAAPPVDELFARIDNGQPDAHTVAISEPAPADCQACDTSANVLEPAAFKGASVDGSKVFFTTSQPLLGADTTENLYEYDFDAPAGERVIQVSGADATVSSPKAEMEGVVGAAEDGSHVYFVAHGVLTETLNERGQAAQAGANNLYVYERDAQHPAGHTAFLADLSTSDAGDWEEFLGAHSRADLTPDGRFLVFTSTTPHLTADDTSTAAQIFEYDAQTGSLVRVSIGQDGYNDNGNTDTAGASIVSPGYLSSHPAEYWSGLAVSADGSYVFFQSSDGLTPRAINHQLLAGTEGAKTYVNNIYEYHDGEVYLISDGRDVTQAYGSSSVNLIGTDASGADVLFSTEDALAPQDTDTNLDIYDARIGGGFPAPAPAPECSGDACQGPLGPAPTLLSPGSEFQAGESNTLPVPPALSKVQKKRKSKAKAKAKVGHKPGRKVVGKGRRKSGRGKDAGAKHNGAHRKGGRS
jgi:hypothetical protein